MSSSNVHIISDDESLSEKVGYRLEEIVLQLMNKQQIISIGLSGGSLIDSLGINCSLVFNYLGLVFDFSLLMNDLFHLHRKIRLMEVIKRNYFDNYR